MVWGLGLRACGLGFRVWGLGSWDGLGDGGHLVVVTTSVNLVTNRKHLETKLRPITLGIPLAIFDHHIPLLSRQFQFYARQLRAPSRELLQPSGARASDVLHSAS